MYLTYNLAGKGKPRIANQKVTRVQFVLFYGLDFLKRQHVIICKFRSTQHTPSWSRDTWQIYSLSCTLKNALCWRRGTNMQELNIFPPSTFAVCFHIDTLLSVYSWKTKCEWLIDIWCANTKNHGKHNSALKAWTKRDENQQICQPLPSSSDGPWQDVLRHFGLHQRSPGVSETRFPIIFLYICFCRGKPLHLLVSLSLCVPLLHCLIEEHDSVRF